ncbi:hypothetical protein [Mesorhizobium sp. BR-1-1-8]|uniref:hypothetical protein n=1 Tax=Mesorhizobium sp. BR-1-1-8 TaxID=2876659 RepID=UPI001CCD92E4|nr:hypothetical protein [Mesorhizobium sp. BR-1-1-8]
MQLFVGPQISRKYVQPEIGRWMLVCARPKYFIMKNMPGVRNWKAYHRSIGMLRRHGYGLTEVALESLIRSPKSGTVPARKRRGRKTQVD